MSRKPKTTGISTRVIADLHVPIIQKNMESIAKRIPVWLINSTLGRDLQLEYTNADLGIWVTKIIYGCSKTDAQGRWKQSSRKPKVSCWCIADGRMHGGYSSMAALLQDLPSVARAAAKLYPPKGGNQ